MSFVDLATITLHRRHEMEQRINVFLSKCDQAVNDIKKLQTKTQKFVQDLNCEPAQLKDKFLSRMKQLDEFTYLITDFNLAIGKLEQTSNLEISPVHDKTPIRPVVTPTTVNLMDVLSETLTSTSTECDNKSSKDKSVAKKIPKSEQILIDFSSTSCSAESVPQMKPVTVDKEITCNIPDQLSEIQIEGNGLTELNPPSPVEMWNLPAQTILQMDTVYPATIMSVDGPTLWIITEEHELVHGLMTEMTEHYSKKKQIPMQPKEVKTLTYCAYYDDETKCYYRALFTRLLEEDTDIAEIFLVDTGEVRTTPISCIWLLSSRFCNYAPYARCCHLAGIDLLDSQCTEMTRKLEDLMSQYVGVQCKIEVDDNTSESFGVYVRLVNGQCLNDILVENKFAVYNYPGAANSVVRTAPPELEEYQIDITEIPEYDDPVEAVTGYAYRDDAEICKFYKGGPEKTCYKGVRCPKRHVMKHPDGWTLDRVEVPGKCRTLPLPAPDTWLKVVCTSVCHYDTIFVQFVNDNIPPPKVPNFGEVLPPNNLESLIRDMNCPATVKSYKTPKLCPAQGEIVAALYCNGWYRARVMETTRADQSVQVQYLDYGNVACLKENEIKVLDPRFLSLPIQAVECQLAGVKANTNCSKKWAEAKQFLSELVLNETLSAYVVARSYDKLVVELTDKHRYSIADQLAAHSAIKLEPYEVEHDNKVRQKVVVP